MKVYVLDRIVPVGVELLKRHFEVVCWDDARCAGWQTDADGIVIRIARIGAAEIQGARRLKVIGKQGVGLDNIDIEAARQRGIRVCRTIGTNSEAVAELTIALILAVSRRVAQFDRMIRAGRSFSRTDYLGPELIGKTVGLIGVGNIGARVARKLHLAFDMRVLAYDPHARAGALDGIPHKRVDRLGELLGDADVVTIHAPLTEATRHLINAKALARMKPTAILVNASRGAIVDERALYAALKEGRLFGAGLDVFEVEPPAASNPLFEIPTVVATPHSGGGTFESQQRSSILVAEQVIDVLNGREPACPVV